MNAIHLVRNRDQYVDQFTLMGKCDWEVWVPVIPQTRVEEPKLPQMGGEIANHFVGI